MTSNERGSQIPNSDTQFAIEIENSAEVHSGLERLFELAGFSPDSQRNPNLLAGLGKDQSEGWYLVYKTSIGGYSYHLNFAKRGLPVDAPQHEISLIKPGPWEQRQDRITVIFSDQVRQPRGIYSIGDGKNYLHLAISSDGLERSSLTDVSGSYPRTALQTDFEKFQTDFAELNAAVESFVADSVGQNAA